MALNRTQAPPFQLSTNYALARPEVSLLAGGSKLFSFRDLQQEAVKLDLIFKAGRWFETKSGVSHFASQMLPKGTTQRNSFQIAESLDSLGAHLEINPGFDVVEIVLFALRKNLIASVEVLREILESPSFDEEELRLMKDIFIQNLRVNNEKTNVVASKEIRKTIFGKTHPYGTSIEEGDVTQITQADLRLYFNDRFSLHSAFLIGKLSDAELQELVRVIPAWGEKPGQGEVPTGKSGASQIIKKEGSVQTSIRLGKKCLRKSETPEYFDAVMCNHVLGGFFGSRLMKNIREEKGLTYGIYSGMNHFLRDSFWVISAEVNQKNTEEAIREIKNEITKLQSEPMSDGELEIARNYFIGSWQSENATLFAVAEKVKSIHLWAHSEDYYSKMLTHVREMGPAQIQKAAQVHFGSTDLLEVRVG